MTFRAAILHLLFSAGCAASASIVLLRGLEAGVGAVFCILEPVFCVGLLGGGSAGWTGSRRGGFVLGTNLIPEYDLL